MALIKCAECGKEISDQAVACPGCGAPVSGVAKVELAAPAKQQKKAPKLWLWIPLAALGVWFVIAAVSPPSPETKERMRQQDAIELCWKDQGRKSHDPGTARFVASVCEKMEADYRSKWGRSP